MQEPAWRLEPLFPPFPLRFTTLSLHLFDSGETAFHNMKPAIGASRLADWLPVVSHLQQGATKRLNLTRLPATVGVRSRRS